ncbi:hypothetical protein, partial [Stenotrophomonas maltophilia]|uniref:hypothetical protein n=1 Tax=Stenotrophomonas maltophilia TaxID=40324 RepID=UPI00195322F6
GEAFFRHFMVAWSGGAARAVQRAETEKRDLATVLEPWTLFLAAHARTQAADAGQLAGAYFAETARRFDGFFSDYDVMLT